MVNSSMMMRRKKSDASSDPSTQVGEADLPSSTTTSVRPYPLYSRHHHHSDSHASLLLSTSSSSPLLPSVHEEETEDGESSSTRRSLPAAQNDDSVPLLPPSPGTPPKKLWERHYRSFLSSSSSSSSPPPSTAPPDPPPSSWSSTAMVSSSPKTTKKGGWMTLRLPDHSTLPSASGTVTTNKSPSSSSSGTPTTTTSSSASTTASTSPSSSSIITTTTTTLMNTTGTTGGTTSSGGPLHHHSSNHKRPFFKLAAPTLLQAPAAAPLPGATGPATTASSSSAEGSVRGGKLFAHLFRATTSSAGGGSNNSAVRPDEPSAVPSQASALWPQKHRRQVKSFSGTLTSSASSDELDGTLRRGLDKTYSPGNLRFVRKLPAEDSAEAAYHPRHQGGSLRQVLVIPPAAAALAARAGPPTIGSRSYHDALHTLASTEAPPGPPPLLLPPPGAVPPEAPDTMNQSEEGPWLEEKVKQLEEMFTTASLQAPSASSSSTWSWHPRPQDGDLAEDNAGWSASGPDPHPLAPGESKQVDSRYILRPRAEDLPIQTSSVVMIDSSSPEEAAETSPVVLGTEHLNHDDQVDPSTPVTGRRALHEVETANQWDPANPDGLMMTDMTQDASQLPPNEPEKQTLSAIKKAFTEFHNSAETGRGAESAYLGDDPSWSGHSLAWARPNLHAAAAPHFYQNRLATQRFAPPMAQVAAPRSGQGLSGNSLPTVVSHGDLGPKESMAFARGPMIPSSGSTYHGGVLPSNSSSRSPHLLLRGVGDNNGPHENVAITSDIRVLKPVLGVDSWQQGRRYLIAPAAVAACPISVLTTLTGTHPPRLAKEAALDRDSSAFGAILLGECLLTYFGGNKQATTVQHWSSAVLVLRQNYLLEYAVNADIRGLPRGYAHLQHSTCHTHPHFCDALELHFYGSPCAKADKRILMIRLASRSTDGDKGERDDWQLCLNRASSLTVSDMYDFDPSRPLGSGEYATVYSAKRRHGHHANRDKSYPEGMASSSSATDGRSPLALKTSPANHDCALKIFDKTAFWRLVVKGRERADTLVREASVQATLTAKCGQRVHSFLQLRGFFETSEEVILELELLDGTDLFKHISQGGTLKEPEAACILRDILLSLEAMARVGLAHRDIKPANILMCYGKGYRRGTENSPQRENNGGQGHDEGERSTDRKRSTFAKVCDFGMSTFVGVDGQVRGRCGTPGYVAPEIFSAGIHGGYGNKVDIFSAGVTLYVMLCGYEPFYGETDAELVAANRQAQLDFPDPDWAGISADAKNLIVKMMHRDPSSRLDAKQALKHPWLLRNAEMHQIAPQEVSTTDGNSFKVASTNHHPDGTTLATAACTVS